MGSEIEIKRRKFEYIDALRGYAIIAVIFVHVSHTEGLLLSDSMLSILAQGARGVQLFFIVSALTLFMSFDVRSKFEVHANRNFFIRRFLRIAPMYYLAIIYYIIQNNLIPGSTQGVILNATFLHGFSINWINGIVPGGWSIGVEMIFYCLLPFIFNRITNLKSAVNFLLISIILKGIMEYLMRMFIVPESQEMFDYFLFFYFPSQLPIFALGAILYQLIKSDSWNLNQITNIQMLIFFILLIYYLASKDQLFLNDNVLFGISFIIFALIMSRTESKILVNKLICLIGKVSFSLYLIHFIVIFWLSEKYFYLYFGNGAVDFAFRLVLVISIGTAVSYFFYKLIEMPFQNLAKSIINKLGN